MDSISLSVSVAEVSEIAENCLKTGLDSVQCAFLSFEKVVRLRKFELCFDSCIEISGLYRRLPWTRFRFRFQFLEFQKLRKTA